MTSIRRRRLLTVRTSALYGRTPRRNAASRPLSAFSPVGLSVPFALKSATRACRYTRQMSVPNRPERVAIPSQAGPARRGRGERGTAMVQFALLLPLLALVGFGTVDLGR